MKIPLRQAETGSSTLAEIFPKDLLTLEILRKAGQFYFNIIIFLALVNVPEIKR
jgi:hypothetical protein